MTSTGTTGSTGSRGPGLVRNSVGWMLGELAAVLTLLFGVLVVDYLTADYGQGDVDVARIILGFVAASVLVLWVAAIALLKSGRRQTRADPMLIGGLVLTLLGAILVLSVGPNVFPFIAAGFGTVLIVAGVIRM